MLKPVGFGTGCNVHFDIRVFYPNAQSNRSAQLSTAYNKHESEKRRVYGHRVRDIEHGSFSPLVFSSTGGMGKEAKIVLKRIASLVSVKRDTPYSKVINWIRCRLSFSLLRSSLLCIRGTRSHTHNALRNSDIPIQLALSESHLN